MKLIFLILFSIFILVTTAIAQEEQTTENIYNKTGEVIAKIIKQNNMTYVYDATGVPKGRCENGQTFDNTGVLISNSEIPGLLIDK